MPASSYWNTIDQFIAQQTQKWNTVRQQLSEWGQTAYSQSLVEGIRWAVPAAIWIDRNITPIAVAPAVRSISPVFDVVQLLNKETFSPLLSATRQALIALVSRDSTAEHQARALLAGYADSSHNSVHALTSRLVLRVLDNAAFSEHIQRYFTAPRAEGEPFTHLSADPLPISQLKKIINSLYHAEQCALLAEQTEPTNMTAQQAQTLIDHLYALSHLMTHPDVDVSKTFGSELASLLQVLQNLFTLGIKYSENAVEYLKQHDLHLEGVAQQAGVVVGAAVQQLRSTKHGVDYPLMAQFGADLPRYLHEIKAYILMQASRLGIKLPNTEDEEQDDAVRWARLKAQGAHLAHALKNLLAPSVLPIPLFKLFPLRNTLSFGQTLITEIMDEVNRFNGANQDVIRGLLRKFKYDYLANLVGTVDKIEQEMLLNPGQLTFPLMSYLEPNYNFLEQIVDNIVDLSGKNQDLKQLGEAQFLEHRTQQCLERFMTRKEQYLVSAAARTAAERFFALLAPLTPPHQRLRMLPEAVKRDLAEQFKLFKPELDAFDSNWSTIIVHALDVTEAHDGIGQPFCPVYPDTLKNLQSLQPRLAQFFDQCAATDKLQDTLAFQAMAYGYASLDGLQLNPCDVEQDLLDTNLSYCALAAKCMASALAKEAQDEFVNLLKGYAADTPLYTIDLIQPLRNLYPRFQPFWCHAMLKNAHAAKQIAELDCHLIDALSNKNKRTKPLTVGEVRQLLTSTSRQYALFQQTLLQQLVPLQHQVVEEAMQQRAATPLRRDRLAEQRAVFLVKNTGFEKQLTHLETQVDQLLEMFDPLVVVPLQVEARLERGWFTPLTNEIEQAPFPHVHRNPSACLAEPAQLLNLKRIKNALFYLKQASMHLELIPESSPDTDKVAEKTFYVLRVILFEESLRSVADTLQAMTQDPTLRGIVEELFSMYHEVHEHFKVLRAPHVPESEDNEVHADAPGALFYVFNSLFVIPKQLALFGDKKALQELNEHLQNELPNTMKDTKDVNRVIGKTNAWLQLMMEIPTFVPLFNRINKRWTDFAQATHAHTTQHLAALQDDDIAAILLEADHWEVQLGLKPGLISAPIEHFLGIYYRGMLDQLVTDSRAYFMLAQSGTPLMKRFAANQARSAQVEKELLEIEAQIQLENTALEMQQLKGKKATLIMQQGLLQHQATALDALKRNKLSRDAQLEQEYKMTLLSRQLISRYGATAKGLVFTSKLYEEALHEFIKPHAPTILKALRVDLPLAPQIEQQLMPLVPAFIQQQLPVYLQLEAAQVAVQRLEVYLATQRRLMKQHARKHFYPFQSWVLIENEHTLSKKSVRLEQLRALLSDDSLTVQQRIKRLSATVQQAEFKHDLLAHVTYDRFTFAWLVSCIVELLTALRLFTPERQAIYTALNQAGEKRLPHASSMLDWSLFGGASRLKRAEDAGGPRPAADCPP